MNSKKVWILVEVYRGIAGSVTIFKTERAAIAGTKRMRAGMNLNYDETGLFELDLADISSKRRVKVDCQIRVEDSEEC